MSNQTTTKEFENIVTTFILFCKKELLLKNLPTIHLIKSSSFSSKIGAFGEINRHNRIFIDIQNRHPMDVLRTVAHELVHYKQHELGHPGKSYVGSPTENEANAKAGILMRKYASQHSKLFKLTPIK